MSKTGAQTLRLSITLGIFLILSSAMAHTARAAANSHNGGSSRYEKLRAVLQRLELDDAPAFDEAEAARWSGVQTAKGFKTILGHMDPENELSRYARWDDSRLMLYQDRDTRTIPDVQFALKTDGLPQDPNQLMRRLRQTLGDARADLPLRGLRVALDPGHMGTSPDDANGINWDKITGKHIIYNGRVISEGVIALQTCLLLAQELRSLGAEIMLTRVEYAPVTTLPYWTFDLLPWAKLHLLQNLDRAEKPDAPVWADEALAPGRSLDHAEAVFRRKLVEYQGELRFRGYHFNNRADLQERLARINAFRPHLTFMVHFDIGGETLGNRPNEVRGYVQGGVMKGELSARSDRYHVVRHLLDAQRWRESVFLTMDVVQGLAGAMGFVPLNTPEDVGAVRVIDGVYARNLAITRGLNEGATTYLEVMRYNDPREASKLIVHNRTATIDGLRFEYSSRLEDIVAGIKQGILNYVQATESRWLAKRPLEKSPLEQLQ